MYYVSDVKQNYINIEKKRQKKAIQGAIVLLMSCQMASNLIKRMPKLSQWKMMWQISLNARPFQYGLISGIAFFYLSFNVELSAYSNLFYTNSLNTPSNHGKLFNHFSVQSRPTEFCSTQSYGCWIDSSSLSFSASSNHFCIGAVCSE